MGAARLRLSKVERWANLTTAAVTRLPSHPPSAPKVLICAFTGASFGVFAPAAWLKRMAIAVLMAVLTSNGLRRLHRAIEDELQMRAADIADAVATLAAADAGAAEAAAAVEKLLVPSS